MRTLVLIASLIMLTLGLGAQELGEWEFEAGTDLVYSVKKDTIHLRSNSGMRSSMVSKLSHSIKSGSSIRLKFDFSKNEQLPRVRMRLVDKHPMFLDAKTLGSIELSYIISNQGKYEYHYFNQGITTYRIKIVGMDTQKDLYIQIEFSSGKKYEIFFYEIIFLPPGPEYYN